MKKSFSKKERRNKNIRNIRECCLLSKHLKLAKLNTFFGSFSKDDKILDIKNSKEITYSQASI